MSIKERNEILKSQKVLTRRVFDSKILEKPGMVELVKYVRHQGWLYLIERPVSSIYKDEVR